MQMAWGFPYVILISDSENPPSSACPCPWDLWCFRGVSSFLVTPVAPAQSQIVGYSLKSMWRFPLLHWLSSTPWNFPTAWCCQWSRPSFCKAMSDFPWKRTSSTFRAGLQMQQDVLGGRKGTFASFVPGSQEPRWGLGQSEFQPWLW